MSDTTFPKFFQMDGEIFRVSEVNGSLFAEIFDKASRTFRKVSDVAGILWDGIEIPASSVPPTSETPA